MWVVGCGKAAASGKLGMVFPLLPDRWQLVSVLLIIAIYARLCEGFEGGAASRRKGLEVFIFGIGFLLHFLLFRAFMKPY